MEHFFHSIESSLFTAIFFFIYLIFPGPNASILELADSIHAAQLANKLDDNLGVSIVSSLVEDEVSQICEFVWNYILYDFLIFVFLLSYSVNLIAQEVRRVGLQR